MRGTDRFQTKKSLGQHFLNSPVVPGWMCDAGNVAQNDTVLEIGPGTGALTKELLLRKAQVIALEADTRAIAVLQETFAEAIASNQLHIQHIDVRTVDLHTIPSIKDRQFKVIANIPYYLSGLLFRSFLESDIQPTTLVYLVQKEVAKRITSSISRGEKESILSLSVKAYGTPRYVKTVSKGHFTPPPKIDSAIIAIDAISKKAFGDVDETLFFTLLHLGFGQKRKQLIGNLAKRYEREALINIFSTLSIPQSTRAEDLDLDTWLMLTRKISTL